MSVLKLTKNDIIKSGGSEGKLKLKRSDIIYDNTPIGKWETTNKNAINTINTYNEKLKNSEYLSAEDISSYRKAIDDYVSSSNSLRALGKMYGQSYTDEEEKNWTDSITTLNSGYDNISKYYSQFDSEDVYNSHVKDLENKSIYEKYLPQAKENTDLGIGSYNKYIEDRTKSLEQKEYSYRDVNDDGKVEWWEHLLYHMSSGSSSDTSLPMHQTTQVQNDLRKYGKQLDTSTWTDEQKALFGLAYSKDQAEAFKIGNYINALNKEAKLEEIANSATSNFGSGFAHSVAAIFASTTGLVDTLEDLVEYNALGSITDNPNVSAFEYSQAVTGAISSDWNKAGVLDESIPIIGGKGWGDVYQLGMSIGQSTVAGLTGGHAGALISGFGSGAASGINDALSRGATEDQALSYGLLVGLAEGTSEMIGIDNLFKQGSKHTLKGLFKNILNQAGAEGLEEGFSSLADTFADALIMQDKSKFNAIVQSYMNKGYSESEAYTKAFLETAEGIAYDMAAGAISGGVHSGAFTGVNTIGSSITAKKLYGTSQNEIIESGLDFAEENKATSLAKKYQGKLDSGKKLSGFQLYNLSQTIEEGYVAEDTAKIKASAVERLAELGESANTAELAEAITKKVKGERLSLKEKNLLKKSQYGQQVLNELTPENILSGEYETDWTGEIGTERINTELYDLANAVAGSEFSDPFNNRVISGNDDDDEEKHKKPTAGDVYRMGMTGRDVDQMLNSLPINEIKAQKKDLSTTTDTPTTSDVTVSDDGKTRLANTKEEVKIKGIDSIKDGEVFVRLENDKVVSVYDIEFASENEGLIYESVTDMSVESANEMVKGYTYSRVPFNKPQISLGEYIHGFKDAHKYGYYGFPESELAKGVFTSGLSEQQQKIAYNRGKIDAMTKAEATESTKKTTVSKNETVNNKKGRVIFDKGLDGKTLHAKNRIQKTSIKALKVIADALGIDIHIFESAIGENGGRIGENGYYDPKDKSIHIDLYAGRDGKSTILFTASHELTHLIRDISPKKFKIFADFLLEQYGKKGESVDALVQAQITKAEENGITLDYDGAYEEVIADACERMLTDSNAIEKLAMLKAKDRGLFDKIKEFITNLIAKIKQIYTKLAPDSKEAKLVSELKDTEELLSKWVDALMDVAENHSVIDSTLNDNGIMVDSNTNSASLFSVRDLLDSKQQKKVIESLALRFGVTEQEAKDWISAETSLASIILNPKYSQYLDYTADANEVAIKSNSDYPQGTVDFSNICKKRRDFTDVMNRVLRKFPNHIFEATDLAKIRTIMSEEGMEVACGICYVEDRRQLDSIVAQDFLNSLSLYRDGSKTRPDGNPFNANQLKALKLIDGDSYTPSIYELISLEGRNALKAKNPAMEEAWVKFNNARGMQSVRLLLNDAEYKRQILKYSDATVTRKNNLGGLRIYSFSDMEMFHLIDIVQVITDSAAVGLSLQGYTKVNEYAKAVKDTGEKLNRSLIPKGELGYHMENGKVVLDYDTVEGIDVNHPDFFDNIDNPNIGNIVIGINATQIKAAMTSKFIDQIIPFHTGQSNEVLGEKGIETWVNYKDFQSERDAKTKKKAAHQINIYTEVIEAAEKEGKPIQNKVDFVNKFLKVCKDNNLIPRFSDFLNVNENGDFIYTEGYHKFLVDFKTFDQNTGEYLPQMPVKPIFDSKYLTNLLKNYVKTQQVKDAQLSATIPTVLDRITKEIIKPDIKRSTRDSAGNTLTPEQQEFFKDSKVRDEDGRLLLCNHATADSTFTVFDQKKTGKNSKGSFSQGGALGRGFYFSTPQYAYYEWNDWVTQTTGKPAQSMEVYLNITNPFYYDYSLNTKLKDFLMKSVTDEYQKEALERRKTNIELISFCKDWDIDIQSTLKAIGHDGIIEGEYQIIAFDSNQIKSTSNKNPTSNPDIRYSTRATAPIFYSQMSKIVDGMKQEKFAANSVVSMLRGRGVKAEEIRWSGIVTWLEGKKSVTKQELLEFIAGSQLQIGEQMSDPMPKIDIRKAEDGEYYAYALYDENGNEVDRYSYDYAGELVSEKTGEEYIDVDAIKDELIADSNHTRWSQYKLDGGDNYREIVFTMPNSTYTNRAMRGHWGSDAEGVLVHARIQDFIINGKKMLFVEELQSDWHNEGLQKGYSNKEYEDAVESHDKLYNEYKKLDLAFHKYVRSNEFMTDPDDVRKKKHDWLRGKVDAADKKRLEAEKVVNSLKEKGAGDVPDAPFKNTYHEYVMKRLLRMASEEGYDSIGWTIADTQSKRWSYDYEKAYRIEYDQEIPKFLSKYGRQWGAKVEKSKAPKGEEIWSMELTDSMKDTVLNKGQVMYSTRVTDKKTIDFLENQEHITTYKAMQLIDGKLYPPMAAKVKGADGKYRLTNPSQLGAWQQATEDPSNIKIKKNGVGYYTLNKGNGKSVDAAYNPYEHSSNLVLNDQFEEAYQRDNLVTVECVIPKSEMTSGYRAEYAKDSTGVLDWKAGVVAGKLKNNKRKVYLSRWLKPVRILSEAETAAMYKDIIGTDVSVPFNVVSPSLLKELEKIGVQIDYDGSPQYKSIQNRKADNNTIKEGMTDAERYKVLKNKKIALTAKADNTKLESVLAKLKQDGGNISYEGVKTQERVKLFKKIGEEFGIFKDYSNKSINLSFEYTKNSLDESVYKQRKNYQRFAKMLTCFDKVIENAVGIEVHNRNAEGYKPDITLKEVYVLASAFEDGNDIIPVKLEVKEFLDKKNTLYIAIALESIKKDEIVGQGDTKNGVTQVPPSSDISISDLFKNVNTSDKNFLKYIPDGFLNEEQKKAKQPESVKKNSLRDTELSNRSLLANALESTAQNDIEKKKLEQYKSKIELIDSEAKKLQDIRSELKELFFAPHGKRDVKRIKELQEEEIMTANRINTYDRQLLTLESTKPLKAVLEREKNLAYKKAEQEGKANLAAYREKATETAREIMLRNQESRKRGIERRNKTELRHKIKDVVSELNKLLLRPTKDKHIKEDLRKAVAEALSVINMDTIGADARIAKYNDLIAKANDPDMIKELTQTRDRIKLWGESLKDKLTALQSAYEKIKNSEDAEMVNAYQEPVLNAIKGVVEKVGDTSIRDMTLEQLESVYEMYSMILHTVRVANKMFKAKKGETITQTAEKVNDEVRKISKGQFARVSGTKDIRSAKWSLFKPLVAFRTIGSETLTDIYNELRDGEDVYYNDISEAKSYIQEQYKLYNYKSWDTKKTWTFKDKAGDEFTLNLEQIMSLYAYSRRDQALAHIMEGGIVLKDNVIEKKNKLGIPIKYEVDTTTSFSLTEELLNTICNTLNKDQKAFVENLQGYLSNDMGAKGNEVSMELLGIKLFKEQYYFPLKSSQDYMNFQPQEAGEIKLKNSSFSKETVKHANNPVVLNNFTDIWSEHIHDMSMYHAFVLPLEDFTRVFNYKTKTDAQLKPMSTKETISNAHGDGAITYIRNFLTSLNGGVRVQNVGIASKAMSLFKKGAVMASASVAIQQPSAIMRAMAYINPIYFVASTHKSINLFNHKKAWAELKKYAPIAGIKEMGRFDVGMGQDTVAWIKDQKTVMEKADDVLSKAPAFMDEVTWVSIWEAVKKEVAAKNKDLKVGSEEHLKKCGERFSEVVSLSQVYDSVFSRSDIMRNKSDTAKALTAFMAEPTTTLNMLWDSMVQGKRTGTVKGFLAKTSVTTGAILGSIVLNSLLKSIITAMRDDDEEESYLEKYVGAVVGNTKDNLNPFTYIPFVKDIVSIFEGYDVERMDMALFSDLKQALDAMDSESKTEYEKWTGLIGAISAFVGIPFKNVERDVRGAYNTIKSFIEGEKTTESGIENALKEGLTGKETSNTQQLYEAYISGDKEQIKRVESRFDDKSKIESALRKALRENDPRIREAAQAVIDGNHSERVRITKEIIAEGHFDSSIVIGAINAELTAIKRKLKEAN